MKHPSPSDALRFFLVASLGLPAFACESSVGAPGDGDSVGDGDSGGDGDLGGDGDVTVVGDGDGVSTGSTCTNPTPFLEGIESGVVRCDEGYLHREERVACPSTIPRDDAFDGAGIPQSGFGGAEPWGAENECEADADCIGDRQYCAVVTDWEFGNYTACRDYCVTDVDCGEGYVCLCGEEYGSCAPGTVNEGGCNTDSDCTEGEICAGVFHHGACGPGRYQFACTPIDLSCNRWEDADCTHGSQCSFSDGELSCQPDAVCGRPFFVAAEDRKAEAVFRCDWQLEGATQGGPSKEKQRQIAADYFTQIALMEHASIAAFARFQMQLLSLGAPAQFIEATNEALVDETKHTRLAFSLASRFSGKKLGPGALDVTGSLDDDSLESILATTILEGCVGETMAALEARAAIVACEDDEVRAALEQIAQDETRHAQLAWRVVQWMLEETPRLRPVARRVFEQALSKHEQASGDSQGAPAYGVPSDFELSRVHAEAREKVVRPCAAQMLRSLHSEGPKPAEARLS